MKKFLVAIGLLSVFTVNATQKITVFAAASLTNALQEISHIYQQQHNDQQIIFSFASSSTLAKQIAQGAPADIFISADQPSMNYLIDHHVIKHQQLLLRNSLVLITQTNSTLPQIKIDSATDWNVLLPAGERMAIGDPDYVPAGKYAKQSLTNLNSYHLLEPQLARANNVRSALMLVEMGEAKLGIVYSTDAKISQKVKVIGQFPSQSFAPIEYPITLINNSANAFYNFILSDQANVIFKKYGFITE
jgi:molybdate transport system substrate-binding protein